jgi:hypothetical protein
LLRRKKERLAPTRSRNIFRRLLLPAAHKKIVKSVRADNDAYVGAAANGLKKKGDDHEATNVSKECTQTNHAAAFFVFLFVFFFVVWLRRSPDYPGINTNSLRD